MCISVSVWVGLYMCVCAFVHACECVAAYVYGRVAEGRGVCVCVCVCVMGNAVQGRDNGKTRRGPASPLIPPDTSPRGQDLLQVNAGDLQYAKQACLSVS